MELVLISYVGCRMLCVVCRRFPPPIRWGSGSAYFGPRRCRPILWGFLIKKPRSSSHSEHPPRVSKGDEGGPDVSLELAAGLPAGQRRKRSRVLDLLDPRDRGFGFPRTFEETEVQTRGARPALSDHSGKGGRWGAASKCRESQDRIGAHLRWCLAKKKS